MSSFWFSQTKLPAPMFKLLLNPYPPPELNSIKVSKVFNWEQVPPPPPPCTELCINKFFSSYIMQPTLHSPQHFWPVRPLDHGSCVRRLHRRWFSGAWAAPGSCAASVRAWTRRKVAIARDPPPVTQGSSEPDPSTGLPVWEVVGGRVTFISHRRLTDKYQTTVRRYPYPSPPPCIEPRSRGCPAQNTGKSGFYL